MWLPREPESPPLSLDPPVSFVKKPTDVPAKAPKTAVISEARATSSLIVSLFLTTFRGNERKIESHSHPLFKFHCLANHNNFSVLAPSFLVFLLYNRT